MPPASDAAQEETPSALPPNRSNLSSARWWLPLAIAISVLFHLIFGLTLTKVAFPTSEPVTTSGTGGPVTVELRPAPQQGNQPSKVAQARPPHAPAARSAPKLPPTAKKEEAALPESRPIPTQAIPQPEPTAKAPIERQPPVKTVASSQQTPVVTATPQPETPQVVQHTPETIALRPTPRTASGFLPNRQEVPLPKGELAGNPELEPHTRDLVPITATPSPLPPRVAETTEGRGGGGGGATTPTAITATSGVSTPTPGKDGGAGGVAGGSGGGEGGGRGASRGTGSGVGTGDFGISRGIPFGDKLGIANGDPRGGGGTGNGGGGSSGGGPHFTLGRKSGGGPPVHIVYVLDVSGSMNDGGKIERVREAMHKALEELRPEDSFNIILFSDSPRAAYPSLRQASAFYVSNGETQVDLTTPNGATNVSDAMTMALSQEGTTHVFLMSDGEPNEGVTDFRELADFIHRLNAGRTHIMTLALGLGEDFKGIALLKSIAEENAGFFRYINLSKR